MNISTMCKTPVNFFTIFVARTLTVQPWDMSVLRQIEKAILTSDIGINPQNDGKVIRRIFSFSASKRVFGQCGRKVIMDLEQIGKK